MQERKQQEADHPEWKEQEIRVNEIWHSQNLDLLEKCVHYAQKRVHFDIFCATLHYYHMEESARLQDRMRIMQRYHIECLPHEHKAREKALYTAFIEAFGGQH
jgi:hypothetical protein